MVAPKMGVKKQSKMKVPVDDGKVVVSTSKKNTCKSCCDKSHEKINKKTPIIIRAHVDVGFGNRLFLRGDGCGLSWDNGIEMLPVADDCWEWRSECCDMPSCFEFKFLINDQEWSNGENYLAVGQTTDVSPSF